MKNFYLFLLLAAVFFVRFSAAAEKMQWDERGVLDCDGQKFDLLVRNKSWDISRQLQLSPEDVRLEQKSDRETWYNYTIGEACKPENCRVVAFLYETASRGNVIQAARW